MSRKNKQHDKQFKLDAMLSGVLISLTSGLGMALFILPVSWIFIPAKSLPGLLLIPWMLPASLIRLTRQNNAVILIFR